jgi:hypothetical protein
VQLVRVDPTAADHEVAVVEDDRLARRDGHLRLVELDLGARLTRALSPAPPGSGAESAPSRAASPAVRRQSIHALRAEGLVLSSPRVAVRAIPGYEQLWGMSPDGDRFLRFASDAFGGFTFMLGWPSRPERQRAEQ